MSDKPDSREASNILRDMADSQRRSAARLVVPWWQDPVLGLSLGVLVAAHAAPAPFNLLITALCLGAVVAVLRHYQAQPAWVNGWRRGKTLYASVAFMAFYLAAYALSLAAFHLRGMVWPVAASSLAVFVGTLIHGRVWMAIWRAETGASAR